MKRIGSIENRMAKAETNTMIFEKDNEERVNFSVSLSQKITNSW